MLFRYSKSEHRTSAISIYNTTVHNNKSNVALNLTKLLWCYETRTSQGRKKEPDKLKKIFFKTNLATKR